MILLWVIIQIKSRFWYQKISNIQFIFMSFPWFMHRLLTPPQELCMQSLVFASLHKGPECGAIKLNDIWIMAFFTPSVARGWHFSRFGSWHQQGLQLFMILNNPWYQLGLLFTIMILLWVIIQINSQYSWTALPYVEGGGEAPID